MHPRILAIALVIPSALISVSCGKIDQQVAKPLADGCYYAGRLPVLKVGGSTGLVLIPGPVKEVSVQRFSNDGSAIHDPGSAWVVFSPAFIINAKPLSTSLAAGLPEIHMMMKRGTAKPTIDTMAAPTVPLELVQGPDC